MQYTKLGNADLTVSRICMGCMGFGDAKNGQHSWTVDEAHSRGRPAQLSTSRSRRWRISGRHTVQRILGTNAENASAASAQNAPRFGQRHHQFPQSPGTVG